MPTGLFDRHRVIDVDTHVTEPPDVFVSRVSSKWGGKVPRIERVDGLDVWIADGQRVGTPGSVSMAGWKGVIPDTPRTYEDIDPSMYDPKARLAFMDRQGIEAEVLFPNIGGFGAGYFTKIAERDLARDCVRAYNDFSHEWASADAARLLPVIALPFWDVEMSAAEIERCASTHRAINFCNQPEHYGQPPLASRHWDPVWSAARDTGLPITFHIGGGDIGALLTDAAGIGFQANFGRVSSLLFMDNGRCMADLIFGGVCHRFPEVKFVSVESGVGWVPALLEAFDWQWRNGGMNAEHPEYDRLPSDYFRRQIYACFWFERDVALHAIRAYPDNILYETDYPHPTCQHPGPRTPAQNPRDYADSALGSLPEDLIHKVLFENAAGVYGVQ